MSDCAPSGMKMAGPERLPRGFPKIENSWCRRHAVESHIGKTVKKTDSAGVQGPPNGAS